MSDKIRSSPMILNPRTLESPEALSETLEEILSSEDKKLEEALLNELKLLAKALVKSGVPEDDPILKLMRKVQRKKTAKAGTQLANIIQGVAPEMLKKAAEQLSAIVGSSSHPIGNKLFSSLGNDLVTVATSELTIYLYAIETSDVREPDKARDVIADLLDGANWALTKTKSSLTIEDVYREMRRCFHEWVLQIGEDEEKKKRLRQAFPDLEFPKLLEIQFSLAIKKMSWLEDLTPERKDAIVSYLKKEMTGFAFEPTLRQSKMPLKDFLEAYIQNLREEVIRPTSYTRPEGMDDEKGRRGTNEMDSREKEKDGKLPKGGK